MEWSPTICNRNCPPSPCLDAPRAMNREKRPLVTNKLVEIEIYLVRDDRKLPDDRGKVPKSNGVVGGSILSREIVSLLDGKPTKWSSISYVPTKRKEKKRKESLFKFRVLENYHSTWRNLWNIPPYIKETPKDVNMYISTIVISPSIISLALSLSLSS